MEGGGVRGRGVLRGGDQLHRLLHAILQASDSHRQQTTEIPIVFTCALQLLSILSSAAPSCYPTGGLHYPGGDQPGPPL